MSIEVETKDCTALSDAELAAVWRASEQPSHLRWDRENPLPSTRESSANLTPRGESQIANMIVEITASV